MNRCVELHEQLEDLALEGTAPSELTAHLNECAACVAELERLRALAERLDGAVAAIVRVEPPAQLAARLAPRSTGVARRRIAAWASLAACVVVLVIGLRVLDRPAASRSELTRLTELTALTEWRSPTASLLEPPAVPLDVRPAPLLSPGGTHGS